MMILTTGKPSAKVDGERIVITLPSGDETLQIALSPNQVLRLTASTRDAMLDFFGDTNKRSAADVLPFPKKRRKAGRA